MGDECGVGAVDWVLEVIGLQEHRRGVNNPPQEVLTGKTKSGQQGRPS